MVKSLSLKILLYSSLPGNLGPFNHKHVLKHGDIEEHVHKHNDLPLKYKPYLPKYDRVDTVEVKYTKKKLIDKLRKRNLLVNGTLKQLRRRCEEATPKIPIKKKLQKIFLNLKI